MAREHAPRFGSDVLRFGTAVFLVLALNIVQVFIIPRRLSVEAYGEYRVFLLYIGYLGVLHFGLVDGAFLRWVGQPLSVIRLEWPIVFRRLGLLQLPVLVIAALAYAFTSGLTRTYLIAFATCAVATNLASFASFSLQAAGDFRGAGRVIALPSGLFALAVVAFPIASLPSILFVFVATSAIGAAVGLGRLSHVTAAAPIDDDAHARLPALSFRMFVVSGLPVLGTGIATGLAAFADRILVSLAVPVATYAFYGFASSTMALGGVARQTLGRVALAHAARRAGAERATFFDGAYDLIAAAFGVALVGEPLFELIVERVLPKYVEALPIVRALIPGAPFWLGVTVVVLGVLQTYGFVRRQFAVSALGAALVAAAASVALAMHAALWIVAASASAATAVTWLLGLLIMRRAVPDARGDSAVRFASITLIQFGALLVALTASHNCAVRTAIYAAIAAVPTLVAFRAARVHWVL